MGDRDPHDWLPVGYAVWGSLFDCRWRSPIFVGIITILAGRSPVGGRHGNLTPPRAAGCAKPIQEPLGAGQVAESSEQSCLTPGRKAALNGVQDMTRKRMTFGLRSLLLATAATACLLVVYLQFDQGNRSRSLISAAHAGNLDAVEQLLASGASTSSRDGWSGTALMYAASQGHEQIVKALLEAGAPVNERSRLDRTPLMWAAQGGRLAIVKLLLEQGADRQLEDRDGKSALNYAVESGHGAVVNILRGAE